MHSDYNVKIVIEKYVCCDAKMCQEKFIIEVDY